MRRMPFIGGILSLGLVMAGCGPAPTPGQAPAPTIPVPVTGNTPAPVVRITATSRVALPTATTAAPVESPTAGTTTGTVTTGPVSDPSVRIGTSTSTNVSQPFLVDQAGRALYVFLDDTPDSGTSACTEDCATTWPAVIVRGVPTAGSGVNAAMLGVITRQDSTMQATYNGWPLYYYAGDRGAGTRNGQGVDNIWFLVSAAGSAIQK